MGQVERNTQIARSTSDTLARTQAVAADTGVCTITDHVIVWCKSCKVHLCEYFGEHCTVLLG